MAKKPRPSTPAADGLTRYQVLRNLHHDGNAYEPNGQDVMTIDLPADEAQPLLDIGVLAVPAEA